MFAVTCRAHVWCVLRSKSCAAPPPSAPCNPCLVCPHAPASSTPPPQALVKLAAWRQRLSGATTTTTTTTTTVDDSGRHSGRQWTTMTTTCTGDATVLQIARHRSSPCSPQRSLWGFRRAYRCQSVIQERRRLHTHVYMFSFARCGNGTAQRNQLVLGGADTRMHMVEQLTPQPLSGTGIEPWGLNSVLHKLVSTNASFCHFGRLL